MRIRFSNFLDRVSEFYSGRKGLLPLIGIIFIVVNFLLRLFPATWLSATDCFLHLGIIIAILGFLLAKAL